ncbi:ATP-dependent endonuclease [Malaciobacter halophilus]|uniref:ATP-dependent endonuclease n=1 Tax=Malaciobacter halophilus TaxID=197482 RepID=A0A2N1J628_9BACT|nr:ATP-dependent endonuclease [Malaciobacter halophilus]AXH09554.1 putative ATP-dependent endonuclease [Malaciobacter halophilus]PKI81984.1 ATP-dependent endonuclease [Malaciobacter halophilus]
MKIEKIKIKNFRLLKDSVLEMKDELSLLIGRNNSGKTSLLVLFEKFYNNDSFQYDDFSLCLREQINTINEDTNILDLTIQMILEVSYNQIDNLEHLSEFILDLDPDNNSVKILFEVTIKKDKLLPLLEPLTEPDKKIRYLKKNLHNYLKTSIYSFEDEEDLLEENRYKLIKKDIGQIRKLINFQIIHAKRNVSSSDDNKGKKILSIMTTKYFNQKNISDPNFSDINTKMIEMDETLNDEYNTEFRNFLASGKDFLNLDTLKVVSDLESNEIISNSSKVVYGDTSNHLPEHLNGLGYMNILYLLLDIEMKKENFIEEQKDINLLFIEEPEAHTHPQMQYKFIDKIKKVFKEIDNLQTLITTHSAQIVSKCDFKDIRYLLNEDNQNIKIKNFHTELKELYATEEEEFQFIEQYLTLQASELFFANKIIFIEGTTEKMLLPYYINKFDEEKIINPNYVPISSQNISILEVGANAEAFDKLVRFFDIQTLIITDIDTTLKTTNSSGTTYPAHKVDGATHTSNATIKKYFNAPDINSVDFPQWFNNLKNNALSITDTSKIKVFYQISEDSYHARSFEDAFIKVNLTELITQKDNLRGLQNKSELVETTEIYDLTERILKKKSDFAFSLLYLALSKNIEWKMPLYIKNALEWIQNDAS